MPDDELTPAALVEQDPAQGSLEDTSAALDDTTPAAGDDTQQDLELAREEARKKAERDRQAKQGRELAQTKALALQQAQELAATRTQLAALGAELSEVRQTQREQYLSSLPEEDRPVEENRLLKQDIAQAQARRAAPLPQPQTREQIAAAALAHVAAINDLYGLDGTDALTGNEREIERGAGEPGYVASLHTLARLRQAQSEGVMPDTKKADPKKAETPDEMEARITKRVMSNIGAGRSNSANPSGSRTGALTMERVQKTAANYDPKTSTPRQKIAELKALRGK